MTVLELLVGTCVIMILIALVAFQVRGLFQKAKVSTAKSTINAYALLSWHGQSYGRDGQANGAKHDADIVYVEF